MVLWKANKAVEKVDKESIAQTGLELSDFAMMEALLHIGPLPINQIYENVLLTSGSMTTAINRLEKGWLVKRAQYQSDCRYFYVYLTKYGRKIIREAYGNHQLNLEKIAENLTNEEKKELVRLLKKIGFHAEKLVFS